MSRQTSPKAGQTKSLWALRGSQFQFSFATIQRELVGFAAYECTRRGFFGPTGVIPAGQGKGIGKALLLASLWALREMGYVYAIVGAAGPVRFYQKEVGAIIIPDSEPGIYTDSLKSADSKEQ